MRANDVPNDNRLRVGMYEIPTVIDVVNENGQFPRVKGTIGNRLNSVIEIMCTGFNCTAFAVPLGEQVGINIGNGTYNGIIGLMQRNEADITYQPVGMTISNNLVDYSCVITALAGKFAHAPRLQLVSRSMLENLVVFERDIWCLLGLLFMVIIVSIKLRRRNMLPRPEQEQPFLLILLGFYINQYACYKLLLISAYVVSGLLLNGFFLMELFEQSIGTELVTNDFSGVVNSVDDFNRLEYLKPILGKGDALTDYIQYNERKDFKTLWKRIERLGINNCVVPIGPSSYRFTKNKVFTFVGNEHICRGISKIVCWSEKEVKIWVSREKYGEVLYAFALNKKLHSSKLQHFQRSYNIMLGVEIGLCDAMWLMAEEIGGSTFGYASNCSRDKMGGLYDETDISPIDFAHIASIVWTLCIPVIFALMVSLHEMTSSVFFV